MSDDPSSSPLRVMRSPQGQGQSLRALFSPPERRLIKREVLARVAHAQDALDQAQREAEQLVEDARHQADALREQARQQGLAQAQRESLELLGRARAEYDRLLRHHEPDMLELALGVAQRIIRRAVSLDEQIIRDVVAQTLEQVRHRRQILVLVHPDDLRRLEPERPALQGLIEGASLYLEADPQISPGGCVIETESGRIDARLEVQLAAIKSALGGAP